MARLASQAKMGFYITPTNVVEDIKRSLRIKPGARLLDPCCGEGEALEQVATNTSAGTYGVELEKNRYEAASRVLSCAAWGDALWDFRASQAAFSLLWLNPPYDLEEFEFGVERERLEVRFLEKGWQYLQKGGVLVYIIPFSALSKIGSFFDRRCKDLNIFAFPEEEYDSFHQLVVMCIKEKPGKEEVQRNKEAMEFALDLHDYQVPIALTTTDNADHIYSVEESETTDEFFFRSVRFNPDDVIEKILKSPLRERVGRRIAPPMGSEGIKPLMPLREGHLAMLLASGTMNGEVKGNDGSRLIVKGSVKKEVEEYDEEIETSVKHIARDQYKITVRAISFNPVEIIDIQ